MRHKRTLSQLIGGIKNYTSTFPSRLQWSLAVHQITNPSRHFTTLKFETGGKQNLGGTNDYWNDSETRRETTT